MYNKTKNFKIVHVEQVYNWADFFAPHAIALNGISKPHEFIIQNDPSTSKSKWF